MKRTKRIASLFLAMLMAFSLMAVTASAYGEVNHAHTSTCSEETIMPRLAVGPCPKCGKEATYQDKGLGTDEYGHPSYVRYYHCPNCGSFYWYFLA